MIVKTDKLRVHAAIAIGASFLVLSGLYYFGVQIEKPVFAVGATIGAILAGFTSQNRSAILVQQHESNLIKELGEHSPVIDKILTLIRRTIYSCMSLTGISILALLIPSDYSLYVLFFWLPVAIFTTTYFFRCEETIEYMIKLLLTKDKFI